MSTQKNKANPKKNSKKHTNACKRMDDTTKPSRYRGSSKKKRHSTPDKDHTPSSSNLENNYTLYDDDKDHSKKIHLDKCQEHQKTVFKAYKNRKFVNTDRSDFNALLGRSGLYASHMPSSDLRLRYVFGCYLINEVDDLYQRTTYDPRIEPYWITFVDDQFMFNERGGTAEIYKFKEKVSAAIRTYTKLNAIGIIETQAIVNHPKDQQGKMFSVHAHVLCWGYQDNNVENLIEHAKGFKSSISKVPIYSTPVRELEGSFSRIARYMAKPPYEGKEVDYRKFEEGKPCLYPARRMEKYHDLRLFELGAKLPIDHTLFGIGEGVLKRDRVIKKTKNWQAKRESTEVDMQDRVYPLFETFLNENKALKNYRPIQVNHKKPPRK